MEEETTGGIDLRLYLGLLWRWSWLIVLAMLVGAGAAYVVSKRSVPIYEASTTLLISAGQTANGQDYNAVLLSERVAKSYAVMLKGRPVLRAAATQLRLSLDDAALARLSEGVSVEAVRDTQLIRLKVRHTSPKLAAAIADEIPRAFTAQNQAKLAAQYASSKDSLLRQMIALETSITGSQGALDAERAKPTPDGGELARLETLVAQYRSTYSELLRTYEGIRTAEVTGRDSLAVVEPAEVPRRPILPRTATNTVLVGLIGATLAAGAALVIEYLDDTVKQPEDLERTVHLPALATVSRFPRHLSGGAASLAATEPRSVIAEAYRVLRTNLQFSVQRKEETKERSGVILLVTSARPREGKTATVANLGVSLAQSRKRVLLVDADLHRPSLHSYFGLENRYGLTSLLLHTGRDVEKATQSSGIGRLRILTAGRAPVNPAEMLCFPGCAAFFDHLRALADYIIVDSPPALSAADAMILSQNVDGVLVVAEAGKTRRDVLRAAVAALEGAKATIVGVVLNKVRTRASGYYRDEYYYGRQKKRGTSGAMPGREAARTGLHALRLLGREGRERLARANLLSALRGKVRLGRHPAPDAEVGTTGETAG